MISVTEEAKLIMSAPAFRIEVDRTTYKLGAHGLVYRWSPDRHEWLRSAVKIKALRQHLKAKIKYDRSRIS